MADVEDRRGQLFDPVVDLAAQADYFRHLHPGFDQLLHSIGIPRALPESTYRSEDQVVPPPHNPLSVSAGSDFLDRDLIRRAHNWPLAVPAVEESPWGEPDLPINKPAPERVPIPKPRPKPQVSKKEK